MRTRTTLPARYIKLRVSLRDISPMIWRRVKHYLWHGNSVRALDRLRDVVDALEEWDRNEDGEVPHQFGRDSVARMLKYVRELDTYIANNARYIVNYGERYRNGERISTSFAESAINQVLSKHMVKQQQMQWTPRVRTCCCKCAFRYSTKIGRTPSAPGTRTSGRCRHPTQQSR